MELIFKVSENPLFYFTKSQKNYLEIKAPKDLIKSFHYFKMFLSGVSFSGFQAPVKGLHFST